MDVSPLRKTVLVYAATATTGLLLMTGCGQSERSAPGDTAPSSALPTGTVTTGQTSTPPSITPSSAQPKVTGRSVTIGRMTIKVPKTWVKHASTSEEAQFIERKKPCTECPGVQFVDFALLKSKFTSPPPNLFNLTYGQNICYVPGGVPVPSQEPLERIGTEEIGGVKAEYYEQVACHADEAKKHPQTKAYVWYMPDSGRVVRAFDAFHGAVDITTLRKILRDAEWE